LARAVAARRPDRLAETVAAIQEFGGRAVAVAMDDAAAGAWIVAQEAARRMVAAGTGGSIINITSILADRVAGGVSPYCAAKAGLGHLTARWRWSWPRHDICVNSLAPNYVSTELNAEFLSSEVGDRLRARVPQHRFGQYADFDAPLLLLATAAGRYMTGTQIVVDGGHLCNTAVSRSPATLRRCGLACARPKRRPA
jgi:NAD(P)-dependent dehydrogenase (short-subunit alcohol dehydrogenase family)